MLRSPALIPRYPGLIQQPDALDSTSRLRDSFPVAFHSPNPAIRVHSTPMSYAVIRIARRRWRPFIWLRATMGYRPKAATTRGSRSSLNDPSARDAAGGASAPESRSRCGPSRAGTRAAPARGTGGRRTRASDSRQASHAHAASIGPASSRKAALRRLSRARIGPDLAGARDPRGKDAVEEIDPALHRGEEVDRRADAHQVARPRVVAERVGHHVERGGHLVPSTPPPTGRRPRSRRTACRRSPPPTLRRSAASTPPCTIPNTAWSGDARRGDRSRPAVGARHRLGHLAARAGPGSTSWSNTIAMSEPSSAWISIARSGVSRMGRAIEVRGEGHPVVVDPPQVRPGRRPGSRPSRSGSGRPSP